ncbi:hypothetical protein CBR_g38356 [Chara braunii]|uniref:Peptidase A2 domain-containing protein n=1 Tax=Chara braunii TaxID=69332 RepID=A0A388LQ94_CHABU|nr:hypothetical protein CBR_g38356 [Chara braunii]|eukprot:GBG84383.1 hypothetical protein CBR_g38356 [Chara braunii]
MARWFSSPVYSSGPEMPIDVKDGVFVVLPEEGTWTDLEPAYQTVMLDEKDEFLWIETTWTKVSLTRLSPSLMDLKLRGTVEARGWVYLSQEMENAMVIGLVLGTAPVQLFRQAEREVVWAACQRAEMEMDKVEVRVELGDRGNMRRPLRTMRCVLPPFLVDAVFGTRGRLEQICRSMAPLRLYQCPRQGFFKLSVEKGSFGGNWVEELAEVLNLLNKDDVFVPSPVHWRIVYRNVAVGETFLEGLKDLFLDEEEDFKYKARLIEEKMAGNERDLLGEGSREERRPSQGRVRHGGKDNSHTGTPSKKEKEKGDSPAVEAEKAMTPHAMDSGASCLPATLKVTKGCDGLWSLRERVLGLFDPEGTLKAGEKQRDSKEGEGTSTVDAKKKLTFDGANITEFLIDYENLAALLKWTQEENMDHLGQHVSLSLGRDIMAIGASSGSWKETRNEMMRKYLKAENMATEAELAVVQRKNYATNNDFLRVFTLVALRILGVTDRIMKIEETPKPQEQETEEAEAPQGVSNLQRIPGDLEDLERAFADIRLSLPDREGGEVIRALPGTKLSFHALPVGKLKVQIGTHHTDALVDGGAEITLIRRDFATITGCTVNREVTGSIRGAGGEIPFAGYVTKCAVKAGIRESIWSFRRMTVMEDMDHDIILGRPWCANVEIIGMHLHDGTYIVDIEDPVTGHGELLRLLGTGGDPPKGKLATWSPMFEESARKGAFARMEGMRERVKIMIEEAFNKKEWIKMGLPLKKRRQEDEVLEAMVAEKESKVELGVNLPKSKEGRKETPDVVLEIPDLLQLVKAIKYHKVGVDPTTLAKFEDEVRKGYCLNGKLVYLFGRRFILRIDPTNVVGALKNYKPIDPTVGRWIGFIWQFDYKVERIAGLRNRADGLSRVCITPEGIEDAELIDAFLEYEGGTLVVDSEMTGAASTIGQLLIQTLEKGAPAIVAELGEGPVTTIRRKDEKDSWGATMGPKEELVAMAVEGGRDAVMCLVETWTRRELQCLVNQAQEEQDTNREGREYFLVQMYDGIFREIGMLLIGNKQPMEVIPKAREEAERHVLRNGHLVKKEEGMTPRRVVCRRSRQFDIIQAIHDGLAGGHRSGGRKQGTRGPSPLREGGPIDLPSDSDSSKGENGSPRKRQRLDEEEPNEVIDLSSGEEDDEVTKPTKEVRARDEDPGDDKDKWIKEFGPS